MSSERKKDAPSLQQLFELIKEKLVTIKSHLDDPKAPTRPYLISDLHHISSLAEAFMEQRSRSNRNSWLHLIDSLDQEGVNLWNISGYARKNPGDDGRSLIAVCRYMDANAEAVTFLTLRLSALRLVEAGLEEKPGIEALLHVLQLASKTGATLSEIASHDVAARVLTSAAKYEESLRNAHDPDGTHRRGIACGTIVYFSSRMEAAWKERNLTVADYMSQKITEDEQRLTLLPTHVRQLLASKFHEIGKSILGETDNVKTPDAVIWLQKAFSLVDKLEDDVTPGVAELKISILGTLARAYFVSESYDRAEATLDELILSIDASSDNASSEYQEFRWLRLAALKRRKAGDSALLDAFKSILDHMEWSETNVTDVLQDLRTLGQHHTLVTAVNQHCLQKALESCKADGDCINRLLLSLIFHCASNEDNVRALKAIDEAFTSVCEADVELTTVHAMACLVLLWQHGDRHYLAKRWSEAADWFLAGSHKLFSSICPQARAKCFRKAALCYIELREYARASTVISHCSTNEAKTLYVIFLTSVHQGLEDEGEAIKAVQAMIEAPDFDRKMLLLATQISHQSELKAVLLPVLEALLRTLKVEGTGEVVVEAMTLIRCIIRLSMNLLADPAVNKTKLIDAMIAHFRTAAILTQDACAQKGISLISKDVSWLWRSAYNCAVQGCSEWEDHDEQISDLFDLSKSLLEASLKASPVDADPELYLYFASASFSAVAGRVFSIQKSRAAAGRVDKTQILSVAADLQRTLAGIIDILTAHKITEDDNILRVQYFVHILQVYRAELLSCLEEWDALSETVGDILKSGPLALCTYEAVADILWTTKDCPISVLYGCLEALLRASLDHHHLSVEKFSRWLRAICTIILARNTADDRVKAICYIEQALSVIEDSNGSDEPYPMDERQWLLATAYNTGAEYLHASMLDEAKRWFEVSTILCKFIPGSQQRAEKISETYTYLLSRYDPK